MFQKVLLTTIYWTWKSFQPFTRCFFWGKDPPRELPQCIAGKSIYRLSGGRRCGGLCVWDAQVGGGLVGARGSFGALFLASKTAGVFGGIYWGTPQKHTKKHTKFQEVWLEALKLMLSCDLSVSPSPLGWNWETGRAVGASFGGATFGFNINSSWEMPFRSRWCSEMYPYIEDILQWTFSDFKSIGSQNAQNYPPTHLFTPTFGIFWETKFQFDTYVSDGWLNHHRHHHHHHNNKATRCQMVVHLLH